MNLTIQIPDELIDMLDMIVKRIAEELGAPVPTGIADTAPTAEESPVEEKPAAEKEVPTYTQKDLTSALTAVGKTQGRDGIIAVLKSAGFTSPKDVGESDYAKVIGLAQEALH